MAEEKKTDEKMKKKHAKRPSAQAHLPIAEIKDGVVILKDGTLRAVILVSSLNFALKSEDEQNAIISAYVGFLNSLDFPVQIVVQSRRLQIKPYIEKIRTIERGQTNELLRIQTADYRAFVEELVEIGQIMTKRYYVVVPYDPLNNRRKNFWSRFKEALKPGITIRLRDERFQARKAELDLRLRHISSGLSGMGLTTVQLDTQALIELYYSTYNPDIAFSETLGAIGDLQIEDIT
jgi:type IV secretory pathway VirB4 component